VSQRLRKRVEEVFGWEKTVGGLRKLRYVGRARNELCATLTAAAYNLVRMAKLEAAAAYATCARRPTAGGPDPLPSSSRPGEKANDRRSQAARRARSRSMPCFFSTLLANEASGLFDLADK